MPALHPSPRRPCRVRHIGKVKTLTGPVSCAGTNTISVDRPGHTSPHSTRGRNHEGCGTQEWSIETRRLTVHQSGLKLGDADRARAVRVDGGEPLPELGVRPWGRADGRRGPPVRRLRGRRAVPVRRGRAVLGAGGTLLVGNAGRALAVVRGLGGVSLRAAVVEGHQIARGVD